MLLAWFSSLFDCFVDGLAKTRTVGKKQIKKTTQSKEKTSLGGDGVCLFVVVLFFARCLGVALMFHLLS